MSYHPQRQAGWSGHHLKWKYRQQHWNISVWSPRTQQWRTSCDSTCFCLVWCHRALSWATHCLLVISLFKALWLLWLSCCNWSVGFWILLSNRIRCPPQDVEPQESPKCHPLECPWCQVLYSEMHVKQLESHSWSPQLETEKKCWLWNSNYKRDQE